MSERRPGRFFLAEITGRHLFAASRSMLHEGHHGPAVVVAQAAVEVGMENAISFGLSGEVSDALQTWIEERTTVSTWSPENERVQRLWRAVTDDAITAAEGWEAYKVGAKLRHGFVHRAQEVPKDDAERFIDAAAKIVAHIAHVMATVSLEAMSES